MNKSQLEITTGKSNESKKTIMFVTMVLIRTFVLQIVYMFI